MDQPRFESLALVKKNNDTKTEMHSNNISRWKEGTAPRGKAVSETPEETATSGRIGL